MIAALVIAVTAIATTQTAPVQAAYAPRVVIVVGPTGGMTSDLLQKARSYAAQAKAYGASVTSVLTPHATWARVVAAAQGANVFIYLGHGNGWPSPYGPWQGRTKDGLGLNPYDGSGNTRVKYYGEAYVQAHIRLAPGAIVLLNRLCYASGNGESGSAEPSRSTAVKRVDNYAAGFLRTGASAVLADGHTGLEYELAMLFGANRPLTEIWRSDPNAKGHVATYRSTRTPGSVLQLDPERPTSRYYRSLVTRPGATTGTIRIAAMAGTLRVDSILREGPGSTTASLGKVSDGTKVVVRGALTTDAAGRTWVPVMTRAGKAAYVAAFLTTFSGSAKARTNVVLRKTASTAATRKGTIRTGARVTVVGSSRDGRNRAWLKVVTASGSTGWIAAWLTQP